MPDSVPLPPESLRFMGEKDDAAFLSTSLRLADLLLDRGLGPDDRLLDVGCGYGRLAIGLQTRGYQGRYLGFDILERHVRWCIGHLRPDPERYLFRHLDVRNARYNPQGQVEPADVRFFGGSGTRDMVALFSVFTHFYEADIRSYLCEIERVLRPGGTAVVSWLLHSPERLDLVASEQASYPLVHRLDEHTLYGRTEDPLWAIGYDVDHVRTLVDQAGLAVESVTYGSWAGQPAEPGGTFQDLVILTKPGGAPPQ